jgi:V/A-type H+-transporting ATPase subunit I
MIIPMTRVRVLGPRSQIPDVVRALQELGLLHLADVSPRTALQPLALTPRERRLARQLGRAADDVEAALVALGDDATAARAASVGDEPLPRLVRRARRVRRAAEALQRRATALGDERALILKYRDVFATLEGVLRDVARTPRLTAYAAVVPAAERELVQRVSAPLAAGLGADVALSTRPLPNGDVALLLVAPVERAAQLERALADAHVPEIPVPAGYGARSLAEVVPRMLARLREIPGELDAVDAERRALARAERTPLAAARVRLNDCLAALHATERCAVTAHAFALEGWLPTDALPRLERGLLDLVGEGIVVEPIERDAWRAADAPVVLSNPRIFRPFEALVRVFPLPTYGTIDPTPFVAVFFPLFFGVMLGDVGYGALLAIVAVVLHRTARPGSVARTIAAIAAPCAAFAIIFGLVYGELFGDVGRRWLGMPALFDREAAILPALAIAIGIGVVHVLIGLVLGVVSRARAEPRHALGTGITALMLLLIIGALLAAFDVLPRAFFTPTVVALLVAFPILVAAEGIIGAIELLSTVGNVLSYARVMALGTASVLMAVVANKMVGAIGSTVVGLIFALLFHLVNFAIGLFSPAIHALRLHYVEFFGKFYSPGGQPYRPLQHWHPSPGR